MMQGWSRATPVKTSRTIDWQICESDAQWEAMQQAAPGAVGLGSGAESHLNRGGQRWWLSMGVLSSVVLLVGLWVWQTAQAGLGQAEEEVGAVVEAELWAVQQGRPDLVASLSPVDARTSLQRQIAREAMALEHETGLGTTQPALEATLQVVDLGQAWAVVRVDLAVQDGPTYRQTRLYRQTEMGWVRTAPAAAYWGPPRRLETEHFIFHYYARDASAVGAAAAKLDALYPGLAASYGAIPEHKVRVEVDPAQLPGQLRSLVAPAGSLVTASPAVYLAPETVSEADQLAQAVVLALVDDLAVSANRRSSDVDDRPSSDPRTHQWYPLVHGVRLWQLWAQDLPLAAWRVPVVRWALGPNWSSSQVGVPAFQPELCDWHGLWMPAPITIGIPLWCATPQLEGELLQLLRRLHPVSPSPPHLTRLTPLISQPYSPTYSNLDLTSSGAPPHPAAVVALATVVEYAAAAYGPEMIPVLLADLSEHASWESLVPAVYAVSAAEFEVGWHRYLAAEYGLDLDLTDEEVAHGAAEPEAPDVR